MISRALLNAQFFIPKDADLLRNRKVNTKKRQNRHLPELAFLILGTYFTAPFFIQNTKISNLGLNRYCNTSLNFSNLKDIVFDENQMLMENIYMIQSIYTKNMSFTDE